MSSPPRQPALELRRLRVAHGRGAARTEAVHDVDLDVGAGEVLAVVGASGSGKSTICRALLGLSGPTTDVRAERLAIGGHDLATAGERRWRAVRGRDVVLVPQHASRSLVPTEAVGRQLDRFLGPHALERHRDDLLALGLDAVVARPGDLPERFSGGQLHRLVLALATLGREPALIVADEPTGSLDAAIARTTIALVDQRRAELGAGMVLVTHDLGLAAEVAHRVAVLDRGRVVEAGPVDAVLRDPQHERTRALVGARPAGHRPPAATKGSERVLGTAPVVAGRHLYRYHGGERIVRAVDDVTVELAAGELVAVVGASGSGKSTLGRLLCGLERPTGGDVELDGERVEGDGRARLHRAVQHVVQDPRGALNPRRRVGHALLQAQRVQAVGTDRVDRRARAVRSLASVGLGSEVLDRRPRSLSGGEVARVVIARALLAEPRALVLDEPTGALDREVQVQVMATIDRLRRERDVAILVITHDLSLAALADRIVVLDAGRVVDTGRPGEVLGAPAHAASAALLAGSYAPSLAAR